jgi:hypothetical protein
VISIHARLYKFETKLTLPRWQEKMMTCRIALQQSSTLPGLGASEFELYIEEEFETSDTQCPIRLPISDIAAVGMCSYSQPFTAMDLSIWGGGVAYLGGDTKSCVVNKFKLPSLKITCPGDE